MSCSSWQTMLALRLLAVTAASLTRTPRLDALAEGGMKFTHCYSMPVCHPTRITLDDGSVSVSHGQPKVGYFSKERRTKQHWSSHETNWLCNGGRRQVADLHDEKRS